MSDSLQISVIGAGTMGNGIAQTFATFGHQVSLVEVAQEGVKKMQKELHSSGLMNIQG